MLSIFISYDIVFKTMVKSRHLEHRQGKLPGSGYWWRGWWEILPPQKRCGGDGRRRCWRWKLGWEIRDQIWSFDDRFYDRKFIELKWGMEIITRSCFLSNLAIAWKSPIKMEIVAGKTIELNGSFFTANHVTFDYRRPKSLTVLYFRGLTHR